MDGVWIALLLALAVMTATFAVTVLISRSLNNAVAVSGPRTSPSNSDSLPALTELSQEISELALLIRRMPSADPATPSAARSDRIDVTDIRMNVRQIKTALAELTEMVHPAKTPPVHQAIGVRELSHALGAPLVQIQAYGSLIEQFGSGLDPEAAHRLEDYRGGVLSGIEMCQALISGYKRVAHLVAEGVTPNEDLGHTAKNLAKFYSLDDRVVFNTEIVGDLRTTGYSPSQFLVLVGPLVENAVEEVGQSGRPIGVKLVRDETTLVVTVLNQVGDRHVINDAVVDDGVSTKPGHEGLGLATVNRIAADIGGHLEIVQGAREFRAILQIPSRASKVSS